MSWSLGYVSSLTSVEKTIKVDPRVPGNLDEFLFPKAKQSSSGLNSPSFLEHSLLSSLPVSVQRKMYVSSVKNSRLVGRLHNGRSEDNSSKEGFLAFFVFLLPKEDKILVSDD